jgi:hypothetical protein
VLTYPLEKTRIPLEKNFLDLDLITPTTHYIPDFYAYAYDPPVFSHKFGP